MSKKPIPEAAAEAPADERALVLCDADGHVQRLVMPDRGPWPFRYTDTDGQVYEHTGEDMLGRWIYLPMR